MLLMLISVTFGATVWALWQQIRELRDRVETLEFAESAYVDVTVSQPEVAEPIVGLTLEVGQPDIDTMWREPADAASPWPEATLSTDGDRPRAPEAPRNAGSNSRLEEMFGRQLPIWAGGITLAVAGVLIVKYSIDAGLLAPLVRVTLGLLFGAALIVGAEVALRLENFVRDERVRQALAGAGIATLYSSILVAADLYGLIEPRAAFLGLAMVTGLAGLLSLRFGAPSALLGLAGGLTAPALVQASQPNVPLLTLYLALAVGGLCMLGKRQRWWWLGAAALTGGFGWGAILIFAGPLKVADTMAVGFYILALAVALPLLLVDDKNRVIRLGGAALGCAQMAALVATGGFAPLTWALFGLLSTAIMWLSRREALFADVPAFGLGVGLLLAMAWPHPSRFEFGLMLAAAALIYAFPAARRVWREDARLIDAPSIAAVSLAISLLPAIHFGPHESWFTALIGAMLGGIAAARGWRSPSRREDGRFTLLGTAAATCLALAGFLSPLASWTYPPICAVLAVLLWLLGEKAQDHRLERSACGFVSVSLAALLLAIDAMMRSFGSGTTGDFAAFASFAVPAAGAVLVAWRAHARLAWGLQPLALLLGYAAAAQLVPTLWLPAIPVTMLFLLAAISRRAVLPSITAAVFLAGAWALHPLARWMHNGLISAVGEIVGSRERVTPFDAILRMAMPSIGLAAAVLRIDLPRVMRVAGFTVAGIGLTMAAHIMLTHQFAIDDQADFVARAMAERTVWELLLAAAAAYCSRKSRIAAIAFAGAGLLHFVWFTMLVDNPLLTFQHVGPWLIVAYATAAAMVWLLSLMVPGSAPIRDWAAILLIVVFAFSLLRQTAHEPMILSAGTGQGEDIARSVLAILLAIGFLWAGIQGGARRWRLASLILMLGAVGKVFLFDAAGLAGLARIASFAALGFSLIGVGWLYSRYLSSGAR